MAAADGHPRFAVAPGESYEYAFDVDQRPGTYWYHPHPAHRTGPQVYRGLAGVLVVRDIEEEERGLPRADHEVTLVLRDRRFDADNQLVYTFDPIADFVGDRMTRNYLVET